MKWKTWAPVLEALEDRLTPSLSYALHGGTLSVTGSTANAAVTVTETGGSVTVTDGAASQTFAVTGDLNVNIQMTAASPTFNFDPSAATPGGVRLKVLSTSGVALTVAGTSDVDINGRLAVTTGAGNDTVSIDNVNPAGLAIDTDGGLDLVEIGFNSPVTVRGNLNAQNVNLLGLGTFGGPAVTVQGNAHVTTDAVAGLTFQNPNNLDIEGNTTVQGNLEANLNGLFTLFSTLGTVRGSADLDFANGNNTALFQDGSAVGGDASVRATGGATTAVSVGKATFGGNFAARLGNGSNTFDFDAKLLGRSLTYQGGSGTDSVTLSGDAALANANVRIHLGAGDDTFTLNTGAVAGVHVNGGGGTNVAHINVPVTFDLVLLGFGLNTAHDDD